MTIQEQGAKMNLYDRMFAWETGELQDEEQEIELFQELVDSGLAWQLQGFYGRHAAAMLTAGLIHRPERKVA